MNLPPQMNLKCILICYFLISTGGSTLFLMQGIYSPVRTPKQLLGN